ncbi:MAG: flagellar basal body rod protein FlgB [Rhodospirillaceae bacterium]|nr:flagellar basal body rod protein FlgB [Rhodospirillaceae bacterium]
MDLGALKLFNMAMTKMNWAAQRQKVLAENVANADTPDYKPRDLKKLDFRHMLRDEVSPVKVARTNAQHLKGTIPEQDQFRSRTLLKSFEASPDGNEVVLEEQMQKVGDTRSEYNTAVQMMQSHVKMLKMALGRGGGA